jgi:hypothetical protein
MTCHGMHEPTVVDELKETEVLLCPTNPKNRVPVRLPLPAVAVTVPVRHKSRSPMWMIC